MVVKKQNNKLGLFSLVAMCVGSMFGAGLFALPQNVAYTTGVAALLIAWVITFVGMFCLAKVFQNLSTRRADLDAGIYSYAKEGFGDYVGFNSVWGYWISVWVGNVGYVMMLCSALSLFFPVLGDGTSYQSFILSSSIIWGITYLCLVGIKSAATVNIVTTIAKIVPIALFIAAIGYSFDYGVFTKTIWQVKELGPVTSQIKNMMLVTVWVFIGIEGATVFSGRAKNRKDVGRATIISFVVMFFILFAVSVLPYGVLPQKELALLHEPSTGALLSHVVGLWGNAVINMGLIVAVIGAFLAWILIAAEVPFVASKKDGLFPRVFSKENKVNSPSGSLLITAVCQQLYLLFAYFYKAGYLVTILFSTAMVLLPYLFSALYASIISVSGKTYEKESSSERIKDFIINSLAVIYGVWLLYAAGKYLLLSSIVYFVGGFVYIVNKKRRKEKAFNKHETFIFIGLGVVSIICFIGVVIGRIQLA